MAFSEFSVTLNFAFLRQLFGNCSNSHKKQVLDDTSNGVDGKYSSTFQIFKGKKMSHDSFCIDSSGNVESQKLRNFVYKTNSGNKNIFDDEKNGGSSCQTIQISDWVQTTEEK